MRSDTAAPGVAWRGKSRRDKRADTSWAKAAMMNAKHRVNAKIQIKCPSCGQSEVESQYQEHVHSYKGLVPLGRERYVRCGVCQKRWMLQNAAPEVTEIALHEWDKYLIPPSTWAGVATAVVALAASVLPIAGVVAAIPALTLNWKTHGIPKQCAIASLVFAVFATSMFFSDMWPAPQVLVQQFWESL